MSEVPPVLSTAPPPDDPRLLPRATAESMELVRTNCPRELVELRAWVAADRRPRKDGKSSKIPLNPANGRRASSSDPATWGTFEMAARRALIADCLGVGINLLGSNFVGIDLDHVVDPTTGKMLPAAGELLAALPLTYTELSPSGTGIRAFFRGAKPPGFAGCNIANAFGEGTALECYDGSGGGRYLTVTGKVIGDARAIATVSDEGLQPLVELQQRVGAKKTTKTKVPQDLPPRPSPADDAAHDLARVPFALSTLDPSMDYASWIRVGAALKALGDEGLPHWRDWSMRSPKYQDGDCDSRWPGLTGSTIGSLFGMADDADQSWRQRAADAEPRATSQRKSAPTDGRRTVQIDAIPFHALYEEGLSIMVAHPDIVVRDGYLVRFVPATKGRPADTMPIARGFVREILSRARRWIDDKEVEQYPPAGIVEALVERRHEWPGARVFKADTDAALRATIASFRARGPAEHLPTGIAPIDARTGGGFVRGSRVVFTGAPEVAKTLILTQAADTYAQAGVAVGLLCVDEDPEDVLQRFLQRRGVTRKECELQEGAAFENAMRDVSMLPMRIYDGGWTIEQAAADLAEFAKGQPTALFIDSIQTAKCEAEDPEANAYVNVTARVRAIRAVSAVHGMLTVATSEMSRAHYRSKTSADAVNDMAAAKQSGDVEYMARIMFALRSVPGESDLIEARAVKNKHGSPHRDGEQGIFLRVRREVQYVEVDTGYRQLNDSAAKTIANDEREAGMVASWLADHQGAGTREMLAGLRTEGMGRTRVDHGVGYLTENGALVKRPRMPQGVGHYLVGSEVPEGVIETLPPDRRGPVRATEPPPPEQPPEPTDRCADRCADTPNTPTLASGVRCAVQPPIGDAHSTPSRPRAGVQRESAHRDVDDGQPEKPKGPRRRARRKGGLVSLEMAEAIAHAEANREDYDARNAAERAVMARAEAAVAERLAAEKPRRRKGPQPKPQLSATPYEGPIVSEGRP